METVKNNRNEWHRRNSRRPTKSYIKETQRSGEKTENPRSRENIQLFKLSETEDIIELYLNKTILPLVINPEANRNTLTMRDYKRLKTNSPEIKLQPDAPKLYSYTIKEPLQILGKCTF